MVARELGETSLMLPVHPTMDVSDIDRLADVIVAALDEATGRSSDAAVGG